MKNVCVNRRAKFDYEIIESYEAGMVLTGSEVKSLRNGAADLRDSYAIIKNGEVFMINSHISKYPPANILNHEPTRKRKLLLKEHEITRLSVRVKERGLGILPLRIYFKDGIAKVEIALVRGRRKYDKRELLKKRDAERELRREGRR